MFSRPQVLAVFPLWDPDCISFCLLSFAMRLVGLLAFQAPSKAASREQRALSFEGSVLFGEKLFFKMPSSFLLTSH